MQLLKHDQTDNATQAVANCRAKTSHQPPPFYPRLNIYDAQHALTIYLHSLSIAKGPIVRKGGPQQTTFNYQFHIQNKFVRDQS